MVVFFPAKNYQIVVRRCVKEDEFEKKHGMFLYLFPILTVELLKYVYRNVQLHTFVLI